jgi:hypothetical protein
LLDLSRESRQVAFHAVPLGAFLFVRNAIVGKRQRPPTRRRIPFDVEGSRFGGAHKRLVKNRHLGLRERCVRSLWPRADANRQLIERFRVHNFFGHVVESR